MLCYCLLPVDIPRRMPGRQKYYIQSNSHASCQMHRTARKQAVPMHPRARKQLRIATVIRRLGGGEVSYHAVVKDDATRGVGGATLLALRCRPTT